MTKEIRVTTTHPCYLRGQPVEPGTVLDLEAGEAQALIDSGRAELMDEADELTLRQAQREALADAIRCDAASAAHWGQTAEAAAQQLRDHERARRPRGIGFVLPPDDLI